MNFSDFLNEGVVQAPVPHTIKYYQNTKLVNTVFRDGEDNLHNIVVEAVIQFADDQIVDITPKRVKYNNHIIQYDRFLNAIPNNNIELFYPKEHLSSWISWI